MFTLLTALAIFVATPAVSGAEPIEKLNVAFVADLTQASDPSASPYGVQLRNGVELALSEANQKLQAAGIEVGIQQYDTRGENLRVADLAQQVVDSNAVATIGHLFSSKALIAAEVYGKGPIMFVSPGATAERLQFIGTHIVSTVFNNLEQAKMLVAAANEKGLKKAAIINVKDCAYCDNLRLHFEVEARRTDLKVTSVQNILSDEEDLASKLDIQELKKADVIFLPNYETVNAKLIHYLSSKGVKPNYYLGGDGWGLTSDVFRELVGAIDFKAITLGYWSPGLKEPQAADFSSRYEAKFNTLPSDSSVLAFDGMNRLIEILLESERPITRQTLLKAKDQVKLSSGALGKVENKEWVISRPYVILEYSGLEVIDTKVKRTEL